MNAVPPVPIRTPGGAHADAIARLSRPRAPVTPRLARPRWGVGVAKWVLPVLALALLSALVLWPEIQRETDRARVSYRRDGVLPQSGEMIDAAYHGVDERGRPYTMTAAVAHQVSPERVNLTEPKGDVTLESGNWMMVQSHRGVYLQHLGDLDLSKDVIIYRDDGTTIITDSATVDLKAGAAAGAAIVHAEGPFGTLDAQGFTLTDKGTAIQFFGPGRLVMNSAHGTLAASAPATPTGTSTASGKPP